MPKPRKLPSPSRPGIRRIYYTPASTLPRHLMLTAICGGAYASFVDTLIEIPFSGKPTFAREGSLLNGARAEKSTLEFRTDAHLPEDIRIAIIVEQVNGNCYLIGTRELNYPVIEFSDSSGDPAGDPAVRTYRITHTDIRSGIPVIL